MRPRSLWRQKTGRLSRLAVGLLLAAIFLGAAFSFLGLVRSSKLLVERRVTLVFATKPLFILSYEPKSNLVVMTIPEETFVEVSRGFGSLKLSEVWPLGGQLLLETVQDFLAVPIDGWVGFKKESQPTENWRKETILNLKNHWRDLQTNLTVLDLIKVWWRVRETRFDKIEMIELAKTSVLTPLTLGDGTTVLSADPVLLDGLTVSVFKDSNLAAEGIAIGVLNASDKAGLAQKAARLIGNYGGEVVSVGNSQKKEKPCQIRGENPIWQSLTARRLAEIFPCRLAEAKPENSRVDLEIVLGEDYWQRFYQR